MVDILFGQSYYLRFDPKLWAAMQPYPPLGTLYAASAMRAGGHTVALFDAMLAQSEDEWAAALDVHQPRFAVLYEDNFNYLSKMCLLRMRAAAHTMCRMARERGCVVIVGGADATDHAELYLQHGADYVLSGEGEQTLAELLAALNGAGPRSITDAQLNAILGLAWAAGRTPRRPDITRLDALPFPSWDLVDVPRYRAAVPITVTGAPNQSGASVTTRALPKTSSPSCSGSNKRTSPTISGSPTTSWDSSRIGWSGSRSW
jgi:anaerobic magnesium-protoporphyrin IX monomethyl ester cyclase